ncbi:MAG: phage protease [Rhodobacteraceae bacterium]|nr:phage protease [Paracoccaceae bacterium]
MTARDGRAFSISNPEQVLSAFRAGGIDLPVDYEHQNDKPDATQNGPVPAAGWIKDLRVETTGLWGRVEWTAKARDLIANKEYRFLSPSFLFNSATKEIVKLRGAGLVHSPALHLTALASQENTVPEIQTLMERLVALLGLSDDASEDAIIAAVEDKIAGATAGFSDPSRFVPLEALQDLLKDRNARIATMGQERANAKVEAALSKGYITPAMKPWATALCRQDEDSFERFIASATPAYAHLMKPAVLQAYQVSGQGDRGSDEADAVCAQLGLKPGNLKE